MAGGHAHAVYRHGHSVVHGLSPALKIVAVFAFVVAVVLTPREAVWAFAIHLALIVGVIVAARLPVRFILSRLVVLTPFLVAAATLPLLEGAPRNGLGLSIEGLWDAWNIVAKGSLGLLASITLAATTEAPDLVGGLERLHAPRVVTGIMGFMIRYVEVVADELARARIAMRSRAYEPRWLGDVGALGRSVGSLFVRSYERGERVFLAMVARGYSGEIPPARVTGLSAMSVSVTTLLVTAAWSVSVSAMLLS